MEDRNVTVDIMKGIGIILVVLYHSIATNIAGAQIEHSNGMYDVIASFFMQLFMILSGYVAYGKISNLEWVVSKNIKFVFSIVSFTLIYWLVGTYLPDYGYRITVITDGVSLLEYFIRNILVGFNGLVLWYLWSIAMCYSVCYGLEAIKRWFKKIPLVALIGITMVLINIVPIDVFGLNLFKWYGLFFFIGYTLKYFNENRWLAIAKKFNLVTLGLFPLCAYIFQWMIPYQNDYGVTGYTIVGRAITNGQIKIVLVYFTMAILGTLFVYSISKLLIGRLAVIFIHLGNYSLAIYLLHKLFVGVFQNYILGLVLGVGASIILYEIFRRIKLANLILFGGTELPHRLASNLCYERKVA